MSPRRYRPDVRRAHAEETRRKIVEAAVALHAEQGVLATTYAMIAKRADVAIPTVYNHFRTRSDVIDACTGHVGASAPSLAPGIFETAHDVEQRLRALTRAVAANHRYLAPWMRWAVHEAPLVPELAAALQKGRPTLKHMIELALAPDFGDVPPPALVALCEILLDFSAWQRLSSERGLAPGDAETALGDALVAIVKEHGAARAPGRPRKSRTQRSQE
jgi:AcrR family transcriptional regulator